MMKAELEKARTALTTKVVEAENSEKVNLKQLALIYGKMEAESASTLLRS